MNRYDCGISNSYLRRPRNRGAVAASRREPQTDEFGCGMAFVVASELFNATDFLDFETAVAQGFVNTRAPRSRRPDFLGFLGPARVIILEAKGNQSGAEGIDFDDIGDAGVLV